MSRGLRWCFTLNNYTEEEEECIKALPDIKYMIYGHEIAPETGTPHLQGYIIFETRKYMTWIKNNTSPRIHLEIARGSVNQNRDYCSKGRNIIEIGEVPQEQWEAANEANKNKWDKARIAAKAGRFEEIPSDLWIKYRKAWEQEYQDERINKQVRFDNLHNHYLWIYGESGVGKSHLAREIATRLSPDEEPYLKLVNKWWTGYRGQKVVIIEEVQKDIVPGLQSLLKQWVEKWEFAAETKGGQFTSLRPPYIIVTSNYCINDVFTEDADRKAMHRKMFEYHKLGRNESIIWPTEIEEDDIDPTLLQSPMSSLERPTDAPDLTQALHRSTGRQDDVPGNTTQARRRPTDRELSPVIHDYPSSQEY